MKIGFFFSIIFCCFQLFAFCSEKSLEELRVAAKSGNSDAKIELVEFLIKNNPEKDSVGEAYSLIKEASKSGNYKAVYLLEGLSNSGFTDNFITTSVIKKLEESANSGNAKDAYSLGILYLRGDHVEKNYQLAYKWNKLSADLGNPEAQSDLGVFLEKGIGTKVDKHEAARQYLKASRSGLTPAMFNLGVLLAKGGDGASPDLAKGFCWINKAALMGDQNAERVKKDILSSCSKKDADILVEYTKSFKE